MLICCAYMSSSDFTKHFTVFTHTHTHTQGYMPKMKGAKAHTLGADGCNVCIHSGVAIVALQCYIFEAHLFWLYWAYLEVWCNPCWKCTPKQSYVVSEALMLAMRVLFCSHLSELSAQLSKAFMLAMRVLFCSRLSEVLAHVSHALLSPYTNPLTLFHLHHHFLNWHCGIYSPRYENVAYPSLTLP